MGVKAQGLHQTTNNPKHRKNEEEEPTMNPSKSSVKCFLTQVR